MTEPSPILQLATQYCDLAQNLAQNKDSLPPQQVLDCLICRDRIAHLWSRAGPAEPAAAHLIDQGDRHLRTVAVPLSQMEQLTAWRQSFNPPAEAWWWHFTPPKPPPHFSERFDWLWTALALACLAISLSLIADISPRFLSGGPDTWGAFAVIGQSLLALLTTGSVLTKAGREAARRILNSLKIIPQRFWQEASFIAAALLLVALIIFRFSLPQIARWYNDSGLKNYQAGQLTSAQYDYERALKLDPDLVQTHYNLGLLYEDLNDDDRARTEYLIAVQGGMELAYNNLARLYILDKEYDQAIPLLLKGLNRTQHADVRYDLYKNLGWARLGQARYDEALAALQEALKLADDKAPAYCLLAQVLAAAQAAPQKTVDDTWEACLQYVDSSRPDEDVWLGQARQHFSSQTNQQGEK